MEGLKKIKNIEVPSDATISYLGLDARENQILKHTSAPKTMTALGTIAKTSGSNLGRLDR